MKEVLKFHYVRLVAHNETLTLKKHKSLAIYALENHDCADAGGLRNHGLYFLSPGKPSENF
jgi:hypothetical protein